MSCLQRYWWVGLYAAFVGAAVVLRSWVTQNGVAEVWGWDYATFVGQINDWHWIGYFGFRHPGLGLVCSPLVVLQHVWSLAYLLVMPAVATATAGLIWRMAGWLALGVWLLFPTTWLMAGIPESFPVAQLALVGGVYWIERRSPYGDTQSFAKSDVPTPGLLRKPTARSAFREVLVLGMFAALNGMITLTNGIKPFVAYVATCGSWRRAAKIIGAVAALVVLGIAFFAVRSYLTGRGIGAGLEATLSWIPETRNLPAELYGFFIRPVGLVQSFFVYPFVIWALVRLVRVGNRSSLIVYTSYFAVDAGIHGAVGWGMSEPWVFAPHWIWMLPLVIGTGLKGLRR